MIPVTIPCASCLDNPALIQVGATCHVPGLSYRCSGCSDKPLDTPIECPECPVSMAWEYIIVFALVLWGGLVTGMQIAILSKLP